jgi:hypothetical protein
VNDTSQEHKPVFSLGWRQDRAQAIRLLSWAHLSWTSTAQRHHVRRLFPDQMIDWRSLDAAHTGSEPRRWPHADDPRRFARLPGVIEQLRQWADLPDAPVQPAAIAIAAAQVLTEWVRSDPRAVTIRHRLKTRRY